jgi:predicted alpha/beta hydrolase
MGGQVEVSGANLAWARYGFRGTFGLTAWVAMAIGHFGIFREKFQDTLWQLLLGEVAR